MTKLFVPFLRCLCLLLLSSSWLHAANLIPNSSFECGVGRGWLIFGTGSSGFEGNISEARDLLTNDAFHGKYSLIVKGENYSREVWLTNGAYTFSFYAKSSTPGAGPFYYGMLDGSGLYGGVPPSTTTIAGTWTRYTSPFTASSNAYYWAKFYTFQTGVFQVDAFQLEPGTNITTYAPEATIEAAISVSATNSMWFAGGPSPSFNLNFWRDGSATNATADYQVYDTWNKNILSGQTTTALAANTNTVTTINLPANLTGWFRPVTRLLTVNDSTDEATLVVYPFASNTIANATIDWLGGHPHNSPFHVQREMMAGRRWGRTLSPNYAATRWDYIEPTRGSMTFYDFTITNLAYGGMNIVAPLTPTDGFWPTWATNANGTADLNAWSNYCNKVVNHYKAYCHYWEIGPNEPHQSGPTTPINVTEETGTNYAQVLSAGISGVTNADSSAKIIAIAGAVGEDWGLRVWTNLTAGSQAAVSYFSTHIYPQDKGPGYDPNTVSDPLSYGSNPAAWITTLGGIRPVWNTESGSYDVGASKGLNVIWPINYDVQSTFSPEAWRSEVENRQVTITTQMLSQALRCIGSGLEKFFYYDSRFFNDANFTAYQNYAADYLQVDKPELVSISIAQFLVTKGFGRILNTTASYPLEMYSFTNSAGKSVVAAWNNDRLNRLLTFTNSTMGVIDAMGNQIQTNLGTARVSKMPQYFISPTLTVAQLSNTFVNATASTVADILPPRVSFDIAPSGLWDGSTNAAFIKWSAIDDTVVAWPATSSQTNVLYKVKLDAGSYSPYSQSNHVRFSNLASGNHTIYVTAIDSTGNTEEGIYTFASASSPGAPAPQNLRHSTKRKPF